MNEDQPFLIPLIKAGFRVSWVAKIPGVDVNVERHEAIARLMPYHTKAALKICGEERYFWRCEQVHGNLTVPVAGEVDPAQSLGADGLCSNDPKVVLGIHVADCGAIYIADPVKKAVAVVHSGRVGTEKNILGECIKVMTKTYGTDPKDLIVSLAPCIRPPAYEVDFAAEIASQALTAGVLTQNYHDCQSCTTLDDSCYSYRLEQGETGRMLALIAI